MKITNIVLFSLKFDNGMRLMNLIPCLEIGFPKQAGKYVANFQPKVSEF